MKTILALLACATLSACMTTTTTNPDGSVTKITRQDPKTIKAFEAVGAQVGQIAAQAAIQALKDQAAQQNQK